MGNKTNNSRDVPKAEPRDLRALVAELGFEVPDGSRFEGCTAAFRTRFELIAGAQLDLRAPVSVSIVRPHDLLQTNKPVGVIDDEFMPFIDGCISDGVRFSGHVIVWNEETGTGVIELVGTPREK